MVGVREDVSGGEGDLVVALTDGQGGTQGVEVGELGGVGEGARVEGGR